MLLRSMVGLITTYQFDGNQSSVTMADKDDNAQYNIAIRAHIGKTFLNDVFLY